MKNLIEVQNIKKNYGKKEAVKGISFNVEEDEILGLLGPNGSGKTTTIGMLLGLLKPTSGQIFINNLKLEENRIQILEMILHKKSIQNQSNIHYTCMSRFNSSFSLFFHTGSF